MLHIHTTHVTIPRLMSHHNRRLNVATTALSRIYAALTLLFAMLAAITLATLRCCHAVGYAADYADAASAFSCFIIFFFSLQQAAEHGQCVILFFFFSLSLRRAFCSFRAVTFAEDAAIISRFRRYFATRDMLTACRRYAIAASAIRLLPSAIAPMPALRHFDADALFSHAMPYAPRTRHFASAVTMLYYMIWPPARHDAIRRLLPTPTHYFQPLMLFAAAIFMMLHSALTPLDSCHTSAADMPAAIDIRCFSCAIADCTS